MHLETNPEHRVRRQRSRHSGERHQAVCELPQLSWVSAAERQSGRQALQIDDGVELCAHLSAQSAVQHRLGAVQTPLDRLERTKRGPQRLDQRPLSARGTGPVHCCEQAAATLPCERRKDL